MLTFTATEYHVTLNTSSGTLALTAAPSPALTLAIVQSLKGDEGAPGVSGGGPTPPINFAFGDAPSMVFVPAVAGVVTIVRVDIATPFDGTGAAIEVGTDADHTALMSSAFNDPTAIAEYELTVAVPLVAGEGVRLGITPGTGATRGSGTLFLTFAPTT